MHGLGKQMVSSRTRHLGVAQKIIHGGQAGSAEHTEPGNLNRRGLARESQVSLTGSMTGQVHQNVDSIGANARSQLFLVGR